MPQHCEETTTAQTTESGRNTTRVSDMTDQPASNGACAGPAIPIIVVGMNRSGTKWLCNILCNHPEVVGIQSDVHQGIIETNFFGRMQQVFGDPTSLDDYIGLVELWSQTDFFRVAGVDKEFLYRASPRPTTCLAVFQLVMDEVARRARKRHWLQKAHPLHAGKVIGALKNSRVVVIQRSLLDTVRSQEQLARNHGVKWSTIKIVVGYVLHEKQINRIRRGRNGSVSHVFYEALDRDAETQIRRICRDLGLSYDPNMLQTSFSRNSSFKSGQRRRFKWQKRWLVWLTCALARCVPLVVLVQLRARFRDRAIAFIPHTFAEIRRKHDLR